MDLSLVSATPHVAVRYPCHMKKSSRQGPEIAIENSIEHEGPTGLGRSARLTLEPGDKLEIYD
jgi:hypothetical protein